jgi:GxxExxY protein
MSLEYDELVDRVIGHLIHVHRNLGPGLLESPYGHCVAHVFDRHGIRYAREVSVPIRFEGLVIPCGYRADFIVEGRLLLELKCVHHLEPIHTAQVLTYLKLLGLRRGLLVNFNVELLKQGIKNVLNPAIAPDGTATVSRASRAE